jgi:hypothetical protein
MVPNIRARAVPPIHSWLKGIGSTQCPPRVKAVR